MPRNYYFQAMYPAAAIKQQADQKQFGDVVWYAFTKYTGLQKFFSFTVLPPQDSTANTNKIK